MRAVLAFLAAAVVAVPAAGAYRNPTPGRAVALQIPRMHLAKVRKNLVYRHSPRLRMDVYRPRRASGRLPTVLLGGAKDSAQKIGWSQLIAASGMAAVAFDYVSADDLGKALAYVRTHARKLGIDGGRLCTMWFSSAPALSQAVRCSVVYYAPLDSTLKYPPLLVVKAGRDDAGINDSIDRFEAAARELHGDVRVVSNASARHGFDLGPRTARTRAVMRETLRFLRARLAKPFRITDPCLSREQRASALRFFAADDTPLAGVELGAGPAGIVLAHGYGGNLCDWLSYAQELASSGYRVLAYDARSGLRVDLDAEAAIEALRRAGARRVTIAGSSLGALAAVIAGSTPPTQPDAVVSLSAPSDFGPLRGLAAASRLRIPVFFLAAEENQPFSDDARALYAAATSSPERRLEVVPGAAHGSDLLQDAALRANVWSFVAAHTR